MKVPEIGESITEVTLSHWLVEDGAYVNLDDPICEFESDKATLEFPAEASGLLSRVAAEGDDLSIGSLVAKIDTSAKAPSRGVEDRGSTPEIEIEAEAKSESEDATSVKIDHPSPAAAKILRESGIEKEAVQGTGKAGRITKADALKAVEESKRVSSGVHDEQTQVEPNFEKEKEPEKLKLDTHVFMNRDTRVEKMSRMRRTIARRLVSAKNDTAMLTTFNEVDLSEVMKIRKLHQDKFVEKYGIKLGFMSFFAKACAHALMEMPEVNAKIEGNNFVFHNYADISIAISTPNGLVVPPVHNVESLSFAEVELKIKDLADKARNNKLSLEEMSGGTFTITNGGVFGSMLSTPILNEPQSAILGMHNIQQRAVVVDGEIVVRPMMYLALSYDHRVIDGSSSVTFLVKVKTLLENPVSIMLGI